ncbi:hypothetical protein MKK65_07665 [Methylobacterium sp. J-001]|uniref:hypothetical protein n=1 Tax=Methylobacterium sp. J-001 TaxID=2836609 RepID=UPI001FB8FDBE|nr:hypothetical protein [Methylobacterium sp. J-001]MCJ2116457.1 hypothetical protein [Methylobacterium sp. J-001]
MPGHLHEVGMWTAVIVEQDRGGADQTFSADQPDLDTVAGAIGGDRDKTLLREMDGLYRCMGGD